MGGEGYPDMRVNPMKHGKLPIELLREQNAVFIGESREDHTVPSPCIPPVVQEIIYLNGSHGNLGNQSVVGGVKHENAVTNLGQRASSQPFSSFLPTGWKIGSSSLSLKLNPSSLTAKPRREILSSPKALYTR